jgi:hypothetical protein
MADSQSDRTSAPWRPQAAQTNVDSISHSRTLSAHRSASMEMEWLQR